VSKFNREGVYSLHYQKLIAILFRSHGQLTDFVRKKLSSSKTLLRNEKNGPIAG